MAQFILSATRVGIRWHIQKGVDIEAYCGALAGYLPTDPIELPTDTEYLCQVCLKQVRNKTQIEEVNNG